MDQHALPETCVDVQAASLSYASCIVAGGVLPSRSPLRANLFQRCSRARGASVKGVGMMQEA